MTARADTKPVIAVVDDDISVRRALSRLVRLAGYAVESFASAGTAHSDARTPERVKQAGVAGFLSKPFGDEALLYLLRREICPA